MIQPKGAGFWPKKMQLKHHFMVFVCFCVFFSLEVTPPLTPTASTSTSERACRQEWFDVSSKVATSGKKNIFVGRGCFVYRRAYDLSLLRKDAITKRVSPCEASFKRHIWWWMTYFWCHSNSFVGGFFVKVGMARKQSDVHSPPRPWRAPVPLVRNDVVSPDTMTVSVGYPIKYWQANLACWKMNLLQMLVS